MITLFWFTNYSRLLTMHTNKYRATNIIIFGQDQKCDIVQLLNLETTPQKMLLNYRLLLPFDALPPCNAKSSAGMILTMQQSMFLCNWRVIAAPQYDDDMYMQLWKWKYLVWNYSKHFKIQRVNITGLLWGHYKPSLLPTICWLGHPLSPIPIDLYVLGLHGDPSSHIDRSPDNTRQVAIYVDSFTVPWRSPNGSAKGLSLVSVKQWEFSRVMWAHNAMGH